MTYSCSDFTDSILGALGIEVPEASQDSPADQAALALAEIERLQKIEAHFNLLNTAPASPVERARLALRLLQTARSHLITVGASRTVDRVRLAISSAKGAVRHAEHRLAVES